jgi:hypothetical protein
MSGLEKTAMDGIDREVEIKKGGVCGSTLGRLQANTDS